MNQYNWDHEVHAASEKIGRNVTGIYKFTNKRTGEFYIGQAKNIAERIKSHARESKKDHPKKSHWHKSLFAEGGVAAFKIEVLEITPLCAITMKERENYWLKHYKAGESILCLNTHSRAGASPVGSTLTPVSRLRISRRLKGVPRPEWVKKKISATKLTPEGRARNRAANKGRKLTPEHYRKLVNKLRSPEHRAKLRALKKGTRPSEKCIAAGRTQSAALNRSIAQIKRQRENPPSDETRQKIRSKLTGVGHTPERRMNQSLARKRFLATHLNPWCGRKHRPESRAKMSASAKARHSRGKIYAH